MRFPRILLLTIVFAAAAFLPIPSYATSLTTSIISSENSLSASLVTSATRSHSSRNKWMQTLSHNSNKLAINNKFKRRNQHHDSFVSRALRHNRANAVAAHRRVGVRYSKYLHSRDTKIDLGCGSARCACPLSENASFAQLRVEAYRLRTEQRLQESAACMSQAMDNYLARAGRYYVPLGADGAARDLSSSPVEVPSSGPVPLAALAHRDSDTRVAAIEAAAQRGLSPEEAKRAHEAAQAIVDRLNRGPDEDWMVRRRRVAPQLVRANELASKSDLVPQAEADEEQIFKSQQSFTHNAHQHHWEPETDSSKAHEIAHEYQEQLRQQWLSWGNSQQKTESKRN